MMSKKENVDIYQLSPNQIVQLDDETLERLYTWVDEIPLSRPKKNMTRDFSDGGMLIELHNYTPSNGSKQKESNWHMLNRKVLKKLGLDLSSEVIRDISQCKPLVIENVLAVLRDKVDLFLAHQQGQVGRRHSEPRSRQMDSDPEVDQHHGYTPTLMEGGTPVRQRGHERMRAHEIQSQVFPGQPMKTKSGKELVPRSLLIQKTEELKAREEAVEILQGKITRLEQLLHLKDIRIEDLSSKVDNLQIHQNTLPSEKTTRQRKR